MQPTQFQNSTKKFKIEFPGNQAKTFISPESAQSADSFWIFLSKKFPSKKVIGGPLPRNSAYLLARSFSAASATLLTPICLPKWTEMGKYTMLCKRKGFTLKPKTRNNFMFSKGRLLRGVMLLKKG